MWSFDGQSISAFNAANYFIITTDYEDFAAAAHAQSHGLPGTNFVINSNQGWIQNAVVIDWASWDELLQGNWDNGVKFVHNEATGELQIIIDLSSMYPHPISGDWAQVLLAMWGENIFTGLTYNAYLSPVQPLPDNGNAGDFEVLPLGSSTQSGSDTDRIVWQINEQNMSALNAASYFIITTSSDDFFAAVHPESHGLGGTSFIINGQAGWAAGQNNIIDAWANKGDLLEGNWINGARFVHNQTSGELQIIFDLSLMNPRPVPGEWAQLIFAVWAQDIFTGLTYNGYLSPVQPLPDTGSTDPACPDCGEFPCECPPPVCPECEFYPCRCCTVCEKYLCECPPPVCSVCGEAPCVCNLGESGIDYPAVQENHLTINGKTFSFGQWGVVPADAEPTDDALINLTRETLTVNNFTIQAYSVNAGKSWKAGDLSQEAFVKLLKKNSDLWLCYGGYNASTKKPTANGTEPNIIAFPRINKRAASPALVVNYAIGADSNGGAGDFLLTPKNNPTPDKTIEIGKAAENKKTVDGAHFGMFFPGDFNGIQLTDMENNKQTKAVYFIRTAPSEKDGVFTAASAPKKITVKGLAKPTKRAINYKNESTKLKVGDAWRVAGTATGFTPITDKKDAELIVSEYISGGQNIEIKRAATAKKPATTIQVISIINRASLSTDGVSADNGKLTLDKKYEVLNAETGKWGKAPKITGAVTLQVRLKSTAKISKGIPSGNAASLAGDLVISFGDYTDSKGKIKTGINGAEIILPTP